MIWSAFITNLKIRVNAVFTSKNGVSFIDDKTGFTLIELVIAIGVFVLGIVGAFTLALANLNISRENINRVLAANLARDGIESIRNVRDSNWLRIDSNADCDAAAGLQLCDWDEYLKNDMDTSDMFFIIDYGDTATSVVCPTSSDIDSCMAVCSVNDSCRLYMTNGFYDHDNSGKATELYRVIQMQSICFVGAAEQGPEDGSICTVGQKKGMRVTSRVSWAKGSVLKHLDIVEDMYNWRR
jgi:type II secretory pathway pseudopilin PulG